jgi:hypothetical protein
LTGSFSQFRGNYAYGSYSVFTYAYDDAGRSLSITNSRNADRTDFRHDEHGSVTEILSFDPKTIERNRNAATTASAWDAVRSGMGVPLGGTVTIVHDQTVGPWRYRSAASTVTFWLALFAATTQTVGSARKDRHWKTHQQYFWKECPLRSGVS